MTDNDILISDLNDISEIFHNYGYGRWCGTIKKAVSMLKEQEAIEPILIREGRNKNYNDYVCPRCDNDVFYKQNYCLECGVRFLWEDR